MNFTKLIFPFFIILTSCKSVDDSAINDTLPITIDLSEWDKYIEEVKLSEIAESVNYIQLETKPECLLNYIMEIKQRHNQIFVFSKGQVYQFTKNGEFIRIINKVGKGPDECFARSFAVNGNAEQIFIFDNYVHNIKRYNDLGTFLNILNDIQVQSDEYTASIFFYKNFLMFERMSLTIPEYFFYTIDVSNNNIVFKYKNKYEADLKGTTRMLESNGTYFQEYNNQLLYKEKFCDTMFYTDNFISHKPRNIFKLPVNKLSFIDDVRMRALELPRDYNKKFRILRVLESDIFIFMYLMNNEQPFLGIYKKPTGELKVNKGLILKNDIDDGMDFYMFSSPGEVNTDSSIYCIVEPYKLIEKCNNPKSHSLDVLLNNIDENDNPIIMNVKLLNK